MSTMNSTECKFNTIIEKMNTLIGNSDDLEKAISKADTCEDVIICLEDTIDECFETIGVLEAVRKFLIELDAEDQDDVQEHKKNTNQADPVHLKKSIMNYEKMSAQKRCCQGGPIELFLNYGDVHPEVHFHEVQEDINLPEDDSVALLFYDANTYRVFPFEHVLRICPWLNEHSVMRAIPGMQGLYYLYEEKTEIETGKGTYLVGPVVIIRLNDDDFLITPDAVDRHNARKFMKDNTETITFAEGCSYEAFHRI